jgi:hypothetical protein
LFAGTEFAAEPAAPSSTVQPASSPDKVLRDPFWPIGYPDNKATAEPKTTNAPPVTGQQATNVVTTVTDPGTPPEAKWPELKVKGLIRQTDGRYIAIVDGVGIVEAGQTVSRQSQGYLFRWKVIAINEKGIVQQKLDYRPLKR